MVLTRKRVRALGPRILACSGHLLWAAALLWLLTEYRYTAYIQTRLGFLLAGGVVLAILFAIAAWTRPAGGGTHGAAGAALWLRAGILLLPLLYMVLSQEAALGDYAFGKRSADDLLAFPKIDLPLEFNGGNLTLLDIALHGDEVVGKSITTEGKVHRDENAPPGQFGMYRFVLFCCAADAQPASIDVVTESSEAPAHGSWARVRGRLEAGGGRPSPWRLVADHVEAIPEPKGGEQYLAFPLW